MSKLLVKNLIKYYSGRAVVNSISFCIESGQVIGLLGPNGAGKTTTFYMMVGLTSPDIGNIFLNGCDITKFSMHSRVIRGLGYLPQEASIFRKLTVEQNLMIILENLPFNKRRRKEKAIKLLQELGILKLAKQRASVLSGGERRRLEFARALIMNPAFMLLDEPFAGVDPLAVFDIKNIINHLKNKGIGVMISDHNVRETLRVCDKAFIINDGKVIESGSPNKIANSHIVRKIYLGDEFEL